MAQFEIHGSFRRRLNRGIMKPMPKSKDRDFFVYARRLVEQAIGEQMDGSPLPKPATDKEIEPLPALSIH